LPARRPPSEQHGVVLHREPVADRQRTVKDDVVVGVEIVAESEREVVVD